MKPLSDIYFKATGDDRENPTHQFNIEKVLDYSNELEKEKIKYLETVLKKYYEHCINKFKEYAAIPKPGEKIKSDHQVIIESNFYRAINKRIEKLEKFGDVYIFNSYIKYLQFMTEKEKEQRNKILFKTISVENLFNFDFEKVRKFANKLDDYYKNEFYKFARKEGLIFLESSKSTKKRGNVEIANSFLRKINIEMEYLSGKTDLPSNDVEILNHNLENNRDEIKKFIWKSSQTNLQFLFDKLEQMDFISYKEKIDQILILHFDFSLHNEKTNNIVKKNIRMKKITWRRNKQDLVYLFEKLEEKNFLGYQKEKNKILDSHFNISINNGKTVNDLGIDKLRNLRSRIRDSKSTITPDERISDLLSKLIKMAKIK